MEKIKQQQSQLTQFIADREKRRFPTNAKQSNRNLNNKNKVVVPRNRCAFFVDHNKKQPISSSLWTKNNRAAQVIYWLNASVRHIDLNSPMFDVVECGDVCVYVILIVIVIV